MCGIVGYIGEKNALPILIEGLKKLEYRGYDSAGVAIDYGNGTGVRKKAGRIKVLEEQIKDLDGGKIGIGHTRWATHGRPTDENAHPHSDCNGEIHIIHNGIIENYMELKEKLLEEGHKFSSQTDTEVVAHLLEKYYKDDLMKAMQDILKVIKGAFAICAIKKGEDKIVVARQYSPMILGLGKGENFIASDIPAILNHTRDIYILEDGEMAVLTKEKIDIFKFDGTPVNRDVFHVTWDAVSAERGGWDHFMIKEINEQPNAIRATLGGRLVENEIKIDGIEFSKEELQKYKKIFIVACGTAYHAGIVGKYIMESFLRIPVEVDIASEFRYRDPIIDDKTLTIVISQSGETADTLAAMRESRSKGSRVLAITNVVGSTVSREADDVFYTWAGPEIAVASTKAYITQLIALHIITLYFARKLGTLSEDKIQEVMKGLLELPRLSQRTLELIPQIKELAEICKPKEDVFFIGRGLDYALSMEGSLKLKEISYIHAEAYAAGELKHGTLALIIEGIPVIALATQPALYEKMESNITEVKARDAYVITIAPEGFKQVERVSDKVIYIPKTLPELSPILSVIPLQLLAYYTAVVRGCDVDKPRNLAKSVTVE